MFVLHLIKTCCSGDAIQKGFEKSVIPQSKFDSEHDHHLREVQCDGDSSPYGETQHQTSDAKSDDVSPRSSNRSLHASDLVGPDAKDSAVIINTKLNTSHASNAFHSKNTESLQASKLQSASRGEQKRTTIRGSHGFSHEASFSDSSKNIKSSYAASNVSGVSNKTEESVIITAVKLGDVDEVKREIHNRPQTVDYPDRFRQTPIFWAVRHGNMEVLRLLVSARACVQGVANKFGYTPLMRAMHWGQTQVGDFLLSHRADLSALDKFKGSCLQVAATAGMVQAVDWLLGKDQVMPLIANADEAGRTPLHCASRNGHSGVIRLLLQAAAEPNVRDLKGRTPLLFSLARNDADSIRQLISHRADVNARDRSGQPLLIILVYNLLQFGEQETLCGIASLLEAKAMVEEGDRSHNTALMLAANKNHPMLCALLLAHGAKSGNLLGSMLACGHFDVATILEEMRAALQEKCTGRSESNSVQMCLQDLQSMSHVHEQIQVALQNHDAALAVEKLELVQRAELSVESKAEWQKQLQGLLRILQRLIIKESLKTLLKVRLHERTSCLKTFEGSLRRWLKQDKVDPRELQVLIGVGVSSVTACKPSPLELSDPYTKKVADAQAPLIESTMLKLIDIAAMINEEFLALEAFPDPNYRIEVQDLQCGKCMEFFASDGILKGHTRYCNSRFREQAEKDVKDGQKSKADVALHRLADVGKSLQNRMKLFADILDNLEQAQKVCRKRMPEALDALHSCADLLESFMVLLEKRFTSCNKAAEDASKKWFPNGSRESHSAAVKSCAICLVERATWIGVHLENSDNCYAACSHCATILVGKLKTYGSLPCPVCAKKLDRLEKAQGTQT